MTAALLTPEQMGIADRLTIEAGVPGIELMEAAGKAVAKAVTPIIGPCGRILVLCGPGNNGGDGLVAARILSSRGYAVDVALLKAPSDLRGDAALAFERMELPVRPMMAGLEVSPDLLKTLSEVDLVIDAIFGAGLDRGLEGPIADLVAAVNTSGKPVLAVDLPTGVNGATGEIRSCAIKAHTSVTFFLEKPGHLLFPGRQHCGRVAVADIGINSSTLESIGPLTFQNTPELWIRSWPMRTLEAHKYDKGHALVFGGGVSSTGAARLSAAAALRAGAGLVTLASPPDALMVNACHLTSVMLKNVAGKGGVGEILQDKRLNAVLIGPGYGVGRRTQERVAEILSHRRSTVLDADALTSFANAPQDLFGLVQQATAPVILTPHDGEFAKLFPRLTEKDKLVRARKAAETSNAIILLKGADTVVASPDGRAAINRNAPPWLATAGSGDVLAGIATAMLAQGVPAFEAACQAAWLHGEAGQAGGPGLIAEDLPGYLRPAIRTIVDKCQNLAD